MKYEQIPIELKVLPQWVAFKFIERENGSKAKVPVDPKTGKNAKAADPTTWGTFDEAVFAVELYGLDGIGFEFANGIFGIDLDHVIDDFGTITPEAKDVVDTMQSYTEYSPSGTGLHIICKGTIPPGDRKNGFIEMYEKARFFTFTGKPYGSVKTLAERTQEATIIHKKYVYRERSTPTVVSHEKTVNINLSDKEILEKAFASARGAEIRKLWEGDTSRYNGDHSSADLALVRDLAYWTNGDASRIDVLFRNSGLMRDKWDRKTGSSTYGANTIAYVLQNFIPFATNKSSEECAINHEKTNKADIVRGDMLKMTSKPSLQNIQLTSAYDYLNDNFKEDCSQFQRYINRKTGFPNIDEKIKGIYPGLYVVGAQSSLGKTTFMHQMGDQLAKAGVTVLFFSLEQSIFELTTKSLARECFKLNTENEIEAVSAIEIRTGGITTERLNKSYDAYMKYANRVIIKECSSNETIESIEKTVQQFISETGIKPVVIIDYLQIIPSMDVRMSDKEKTDQHMRRLKVLQRDNDLVLFVISSLNRANYLAEISFDSFKESGSIEYSADVVWGMQYSSISNSSSTQNKINQQRRNLQDAKRANPRKIELVCLKNRYGCDYSVYFDYYPKFDYFAVDRITAQMKALEK